METAMQLTTASAEAWSNVAPGSARVLALILPDDRPTDLDRLATRRCPAALPFAGKYRLIDWALSNCINSGIETVGVIAPNQPHRLCTDLDHSCSWDLDRDHLEITILRPHPANTGVGGHLGTADAVHQHQEFILHHQTDDVLVVLGSRILNIDLNVLTAQHHKTEADVTVVVTAVGQHSASRFSTLLVDHEGRIRKFVPPGTGTPGPLVLVGILLFSRDVLSWQLGEDARRAGSDHDLNFDVIPHMIAAGNKVMAFEHTGYWNNIRTVRDYWQAHMDLLSQRPALTVQDPDWPIRTQPEFRPPTRIEQGAVVTHSLVCEGCTLYGTVEHSVLSPGVYVAAGAVVRNSIVMHDAIIQERATVENAILGAGVIVGPQARIGQIHRHAPTLQVSSPDQVTIVEQGVHIPDGGVVKADL